MSLSGHVYSFGRGDAGELGWKDADDDKGRINPGYFEWKPTKVGGAIENYAAKQINCGSHHNIIVSIGGENVFAWGFGDNAALGKNW
jgi:alpha-tubulin suppressor-like RCC1 family protein